MTLLFDKKGVLLADVPGAGVSTVDPNAKSGNPRHDVRSGKFGAGGRSAHGPQPPANVDPVEWARFVDAVRTAAREFDWPNEGDIRDFLNGHAKNPGAVDQGDFLRAVQEQKISDLVDALDQQMRGSGILTRNRPRVRLVAPKGYVKKILGVVDDSHLAEIHHRLEALGHDPEEVNRFLKGRVHEKRHEALDKHRAAIHASDQWEGDLQGWPPPDFDIREHIGGLPAPEQFVEMAQAVAKVLPPTVVNVEPHITVEAPPPRKRIPVRDPRTGIITEIQEVVED